MKISVEISDSDLKDICRFTGEKKKGPAIRKIVADALMLRRRAAFVQDVLSGKWGAQLEGYEEAQEVSRKKSHARAQAWR